MKSQSAALGGILAYLARPCSALGHIQLTRVSHSDIVQTLGEISRALDISPKGGLLAQSNLIPELRAILRIIIKVLLPQTSFIRPTIFIFHVSDDIDLYGSVADRSLAHRSIDI